MAYENPSVARVTLIGSRDGREMVNTFHVTTVPAAPLTSTDLPLIASVFQSWFTSYYKLWISPPCALNQIQVRKQSAADPLAYDLDVGSIPGIAPGVAAPANVTAAISWRSGLAGRKNRGRFFAWGLPIAHVTPADLLTSAYTTGMALVGANLLTSLSLVPAQLVIAHRTTNLYTPVSTCVVEGIVDSQRRRLPGRGR